MPANFVNRMKPTRIAGFLVLAGGIATIVCVLVVAGDPSSYFFYSPEDRARWVYPLRHIVIVCGAVLGEALVAASALALDRPPRLWARCAVALLVLVPWALFTFQIVMHAPRYVHFHHLWLAAVLLVLVAFGLASGVRHIWSVVALRGNAA